jgi:hypothetical protein
LEKPGGRSARRQKRYKGVSAPGSVTVVLGGKLSAVVKGTEVVDENGSLRGDSGNGLRVGHARSVTEREDVAELAMGEPLRKSGAV